LKNKITSVKKDILKLKESDNYILIAEILDVDGYINMIKEKLQNEILELKKNSREVHI
jgi:hypothetical protein